MRLYRIVAAMSLFLGAAAFAAAPGKEPHSSKPARGKAGSVEIELSLLSEKIKPGESLFIKTSLKNLSKDSLSVREWIYRGSRELIDEWSKNCDLRMSTFVEIRDSNGRPVKPRVYASRYDVNPLEIKVSSPDAATLKSIAEWKAQGLDDEQINSKLEDLSVSQERMEREAKYPPLILRQGQSVGSVSWCSGRSSALAQTVCPGDGYVEMPIFVFDRPGRYKIRAVRDFRPSKGANKPADQWDVLAATPWIPFEVSQ